MRHLLDTHTFLWFLSGDPRVPDLVKDLIEDEAAQNLVSIASVWEIAIKHSLGKLQLREPLGGFLDEQFRDGPFGLLRVELAHLEAVSTLPFHHRDPFDRLLAAQASVEGLPLVTGDRAFDAYPVQRIWS